MFTLNPDHIYRSESLSRIPGLRHGFGTRTSSDWPGAIPTAIVRQVHSDRVVMADKPGQFGEADALITNQPGFLLAVRTADCVPALIVDPRTHSVAAVHAGWRGTAAEILPKTLHAMSERFGTVSAEVLVAVGPAIAECCFEVGPEVASAFQTWLPERTDLSRKTTIDLRQVNARQLRAAGVPPDNVTILDECTRCGERFHSWRRDAERAGRMVSGIGWIS